MTRRELYQLVAELLPQLGGASKLLDAVAAEMGGLRKSPTGQSHHQLQGLHDLLAQDDALGQIYQAINSPALETAYRATARERRKFSADEIPAVTQLFTPRWVVEFLLHNTLGRLWRDMHPDTRLHWKWLVKSESLQQPARRAVDLRICDPACGTMNFGLVAVDMLRKMYREEIDRAGSSCWSQSSCVNPLDIDQAIIRNNLFGYDIDPVAIDLARKTLEIKIGDGITQHHLGVADALFDLKSEGEFDVIVTNPPYLSARNLDPAIVKRLKKKFPNAWRDYYACFLIQSLQLCRPGGLSGILCMHSFMFTAAFEKLRRQISELADVRVAAHFGPGLFEIGNPGTLQTAAVVLRRESLSIEDAVFFRLVDAADKQLDLESAIENKDSPIRLELSQSQLISSPRMAWMYWLPETHRKIFREFPALGELAPPRQGLATTDNRRFVRYWWEVEKPGFRGARTKWIPYAKGGRFFRWHESPRHRVDWEDDGREIKRAIVDRYPYLNGQWKWVAKNSDWYGKPGITYSYLTSGTFSARRLEAGTFFDVAGSSLFPEDPLPLLGILNSSTARRMLMAINPTVNFQVGDLRLLPLPLSLGDELRGDVQSAIDLAKQLDRCDETSSDFHQPAGWEDAGEIPSQLKKIEHCIDQTVARLYGLEPDFSPINAVALDRRDLARRWISYAFGMWLGRWKDGTTGRIAQLSPLDRTMVSAVREILAERAGVGDAENIESAVGGIDPFLSNDFLPWHNRLYHNRPVFWGFSGAGRVVVIHAWDADAGLMREILRSIGGDLPSGWQLWRDDGIAVNLAPLAGWIADRKLQKSLKEINQELREDRLGFSRTSRWLGDANFNRGSICVSVPLQRKRRKGAIPQTSRR